MIVPVEYHCLTPECALHLSKARFPEPIPCPICSTPLQAAPLSEADVELTDLERRVLGHYPFVLARPYYNMLKEADGRGKLDLLAYTFQNALKYLGLLVVGEYHASNLRLPEVISYSSTISTNHLSATGINSCGAPSPSLKHIDTHGNYLR